MNLWLIFERELERLNVNNEGMFSASSANAFILVQSLAKIIIYLFTLPLTTTTRVHAQLDIHIKGILSNRASARLAPYNYSLQQPGVANEFDTVSRSVLYTLSCITKNDNCPILRVPSTVYLRFLKGGRRTLSTHSH